ncbi:ParA family protein [Cryobacterium sp. TMT2-4]|uniref:nucleotide-binding protein n=1 Tax=Cryobacterium sp. TMT2-4 TaxID=1259254 RepID=UPI001069263F|nr:ParA family protein [Cryobacterium sp. TMT2-4]TFC63831.1 ParA family protein [Cryobacterium sp. TMT2-4]
MSDTGRTAPSEVFGAADRAGDYVEEDTLHTLPVPPRRKTASSAPALRTIPAAAPVEAPAAQVAPSAPAVTPTDLASTSVLFGGSAASLGTASSAPAKATTGFRGALASLGLPVGPGAAELGERRRTELQTAHETTVRQATWTRAVSVLVNNPKGGTGKTPTALLLGGVLAAIRGGSVAILEVSDDPGALNFRAEGNPLLGLGELVRDVDHVQTAGRLAGYTAPQTSFASVIGSTGRRDRLTGESVVAVSNVIDDFYSIRVMDSGNVPTSSAFRGAVSVSDVLVIPVMNAGDSVLEAIQLLEELRAEGGAAAELANRAIAIRLTDGRPENDAVRQEVERLLSQAGVSALHEIPYDSHIAERGQLTLSRLNPATRDAFVAAAASVVRYLQTAVSAAPTQNRKA